MLGLPSNGRSISTFVSVNSAVEWVPLKKGRSREQELRATKAHLSEQVRNIREALNCCYPAAVPVTRHSLEHWSLLSYMKHSKQAGLDRPAFRTTAFEGNCISPWVLSLHTSLSVCWVF